MKRDGQQLPTCGRMFQRLAIALLLAAVAPTARAQDIPLGLAAEAAPAAVEPAAKPAETKPADGKPAAAKPSDTAGLGQRSDKEVTTGDQLGFREQQVHEEMAELEQRMFRLSEALKKLEPENSSRLVTGLKYAREELILHQMKEVQTELVSLSLKGAIEEQKQLIAKLDRLQQLLLSTDLDFEMRLERLKAIRETLRQLDTVIKEEAREEKLSKKAAELETELAKLNERKASLEELVKQQTEHVAKNTPLAKAESLTEEQKTEAGQLSKEQAGTRESAQKLAADLQEGATPKNLSGAVASMQQAEGALDKTAPSEAQPAMEKALEQLKQELAEIAKKQAEAQQALAKEKFEAMRKDQEGNRAATDRVSDMTRELGSNGSAALSELLKASGSMSNAEGALGQSQAGQGNSEQRQALSSLNYARELLAEEAERLARQLRAEVIKKVTEGLTEMLEMQVAVRERTVALAPGVKQGSRDALAALTAVSKREEKITSKAQELIDIVEETEFGIALPAALAAVRDATESVQVSLAEGDASAEVVKAEEQIEADLKAMLEVVNEMSDANSRQGRRNRGNSAEEERKELNRIISELKMIRLLETRVKQSTVDVDAKRANTEALSPSLRKQVEHLDGRQSDIQEATELLANERGDELPPPE